MRKLVFMLFPAIAALAVLGCSADDGMPCLNCDEPFPPQDGIGIPQPPQNQYTYCLVYYGYYECSYMSVYDCSREGGSTYSDRSCGNYWWQSSNPQPSSSSRLGSSSSSRPVSSSSSRPASSSSFRPPNVISGPSITYADGETYQTVVIGRQTWFRRNLNYNPGTGNSRCYENDDYYCAEYGRLYDWATAMNIDSRYNSEYWNGSDVNHRGICPSGWHIPNNDDWSELVSYVENYWGCSSCAARYLKSQYGWNSGGNGEDAFGFAALPGGYGSSDGNFDGVGDYGNWWSASGSDAGSAYGRYMDYGHEYVYWYDINKSNTLFSVRCLQD